MNAKLVDLSAMVAAVSVEPVTPKPSAVTAKTFLLAIRAAGMRVADDGRRYRDPGQIRYDESVAIGTFCGYNVSGAHGSQLDAATQLAQKLLRPVTPATTEYRRGCSAPTGNGVVFGMPDRIARAEQDVRARILFRGEVAFQCQQKGDTKGALAAQSKIASLRKILETRDFTAILKDQEKAAEPESLTETRVGWDLGSFGSSE